MSVGDTIQRNGLDEAIMEREKLMREGYDVDLEYGQGKAVLTITEVPEE